MLPDGFWGLLLLDHASQHQAPTLQPVLFTLLPIFPWNFSESLQAPLHTHVDTPKLPDHFNPAA